MTERTPPHNAEAEAALIGGAMLSPDALEVVATEVEPEDFYSPALQVVCATLHDMWREGVQHADPVLVSDELTVRGLLDRAGGTAALVDLVASAPSTTSAGRYARIVAENATLRRLIASAAAVVDDAYGRPADVSRFIDEARTELAAVELPVATGRPSPNVAEFLADIDPEPDWLVPGLLERGDRLIVTAGEGVGKSTLLRQMAVATASGKHPFNGSPIPPRSVLYIDLENSPSQIRRNIEPLVWIGGRELDPDRLRIESRLDGVDLLGRHDRNWLLERVASNMPDLLIIGPIYKMHAGPPNDEEPARSVIGVLDMIRARFGCTLVMEAHSPHAAPGSRRPLRPMGASIWMRWPEFGFGMREEIGEDRQPTGAVSLLPWRGSREEREWPWRLSRNIEGHWPWRDSAHREPYLEQPGPAANGEAGGAAYVEPF